MISADSSLLVVQRAYWAAGLDCISTNSIFCTEMLIAFEFGRKKIDNSFSMSDPIWCILYT